MYPRRSTLLTLCASVASAALSGSAAAWDMKRRAQDDTRAAHFTNRPFVDQNGQPLRFYDDVIRGKMVVVNMMYTACTSICPGNTANLLSVQAALGDRIGRDIHMVSISLMPELDAPADLRAYMRRYRVKPGWTFLTGPRSSVDLVRRRLGFYDSDPVADADPYRHTGMISVGNDRIDRWCMMPSLSATHQIVRAIEEMA